MHSRAHLPVLDKDDLGDSHARNVILMIRDGMGLSHETMARIERAGWNLSRYSETQLQMDSMEHTGFLRTFSANSFVTDSAPASTAMATARKTNICSENLRAVDINALQRN